MSKPTLESLFREVTEKFLRANDGLRVRGEQGVFSFALIVWLGIQQRLTGGSFREGLKAFVDRQKAGELDFLIGRVSCKFREQKVSTNTGGISRARDRVTEELISELYLAANRNIEARFKSNDHSRPVYLLDGQVTSTSRTKMNVEAFGSAMHGQGELHYPKIRIVAAHKLSTGVASKVAVGSYRDSEVKLARELFAELPNNALLVMDRGFDKPNFLDAAISTGLHVLVRLKDATGKKLLGDSDRNEFCNKTVEWTGKQKDGQPVQLRGQVIKFVSEDKGFRSNHFYIFTSDLSLTLQDVAHLYRQRVRVEVFIRDIKQKLNLNFIRAKKPENVRKEVLLAYLTFNLVRAIMYDTATATGTDVTRLSFSTTVLLCSAYANAFLLGRETHKSLTAQFRTHLVQAKLPLRKKSRSYPRVVKKSRDKYPSAAIIKSDNVNTEFGK